jgi:EF hand
MTQVGINFQANAPIYTGRPFQPQQGGYQIYALLLGVAGQLSYGGPQGPASWGGQAGGAFASLGGYLGQGGGQYFGQQAGFGGYAQGGHHHGHDHAHGQAGFGGFGGYQHAGGAFQGHYGHGGLQNNKMWDVWFDHTDGQTTQRRSPIVLDLNHNGKADITGKNVTGDGKIDGPTTLFDLDPTKASYEFKSRARRPGRGAPAVEGGHWQGGQYLDKNNNVVGELKGDDYQWGKLEPREKTEWLAKDGGDGMLVWDVNNDGQITSSKELFGNYDINGQERFKNGYEKLAHYFDRNKDGQVGGAELQGLQIWKDGNADGVVQQGELVSLQSQNIHNFDVSNYNRETMESNYTTHAPGHHGHFGGQFGYHGQFGGQFGQGQFGGQFGQGHFGGQFGQYGQVGQGQFGQFPQQQFPPYPQQQFPQQQFPQQQFPQQYQQYPPQQQQQFQQLQQQLMMLLSFIMQFAFQGGGQQWAGLGAGQPQVAPPQGPPPKETTGNPKNWYFQHGKYKKEKTDYGHVQTQGDVRIEYDEKAKTGHVFKKVDGNWQLDEVRKDWGGKAASPIMLDMDGDGKADVAGGEWKAHAEKGDIGAHKVRFDLDGDGKKELSEWTGGKDGLLLKLSDEQVQQYQTKGQLEVSGKELYGDEGGKYKDGYAKMQALSDADKDGQLSGKELDKHYVWQDTNRDGVVDKGELKSAQDAGITKVKATHAGDFQSAFEMNGETRKTWDWWPTTWN